MIKKPYFNLKLMRAINWMIVIVIGVLGVGYGGYVSTRISLSNSLSTSYSLNATSVALLTTPLKMILIRRPSKDKGKYILIGEESKYCLLFESVLGT